MAILSERIRRNNVDDQIYLGQLVEKNTKGEFGDLLKLIINGIVEEQLQASQRDAKIPADRYLGRLESLSMLQERLIMMVDNKDSLTAEKRESLKVKGEDTD